MSKHVFTVVVAVIIGVSLLLYMFAFQVRESEVAVVLRFGKPAAQLPKFMVVSEGYTNLIAGFESVLTKNYAPILPNSGGYLIYEKN